MGEEGMGCTRKQEMAAASPSVAAGDRPAGLALRAPLPRRARDAAGEVFPNNREDETSDHRSQSWPNFTRRSPYLQPNPNNPRTPVPPAMDEQLLASIKAVGIIQPPCITPKDDGLMIVVGNRKVKAAITADLPVIDVLAVCDTDRAACDAVGCRRI